jgi:hypothetical protein
MFDSGGISTGRDRIYHAMEGNGEEYSQLIVLNLASDPTVNKQEFN